MTITSISHLSIRLKLIGAILAVSALALILSSSALFAYEWLSLKRNLANDLHTLADVIGINGGVGLVFNNREAMEQTLSSLQAKPNVIFAHAYDRQGKYFASYIRQGARDEYHLDNLIYRFPSDMVGIGPLDKTYDFFFDNHVDIFSPIQVDGDLLGMLYIRSDLREFEHRRDRYLGIVGLAVLLALLLAYPPASWIQGIVTQPVHHLLATINQVREKQDYSLRTVKTSHDELGRLHDGFNAMLAKIDADNHELNNYRHNLEAIIQERTQEKEQAERANEAKTRFFAAASHDLRQPLHALDWFLDLLHEKAKNQETGEIVAKAQQSVAAMQGLFNSLLDISRLESGVVNAEMQVFSLHRLCHSLADEFNAQARMKGIDFRINVPKVHVHSDPLLLERVLRNLLGNAIKYTEKGGVSLNTRNFKETVEVTISDTGIGIPKQYQQEIFEEFRQLDNPERDRAKGLGLGLSIVQRIVKLLKHPLDLESTPGKGTSFTLHLPLVDAPTTQLTSMTTAMPAIDSSEAVIVLIDDEEQIRDAMGHRLTEWGYRMIVAEDLEHAMEKLNRKQWQPDLVIADYRLRNNHTGTEAIAALREHFGSSLPAIIITGDTLPEHLRNVRTSGNQVLLKPIKPAHLRKLVSYLLRKTPE
jgi:signal transduction histidine kinase